MNKNTQITVRLHKETAVIVIKNDEIFRGGFQIDYDTIPL